MVYYISWFITSVGLLHQLVYYIRSSEASSIWSEISFKMLSVHCRDWSHSIARSFDWCLVPSFPPKMPVYNFITLLGRRFGPKSCPTTYQLSRLSVIQSSTVNGRSNCAHITPLRGGSTQVKCMCCSSACFSSAFQMCQMYIFFLMKMCFSLPFHRRHASRADLDQWIMGM